MIGWRGLTQRKARIDGAGLACWCTTGRFSLDGLEGVGFREDCLNEGWSSPTDRPPVGSSVTTPVR